LKQVCLLQVLAQTGCFVPADFAAFPIITRIFSRIGHNDDLSSNLSAFAVEVSEVVPVLANANSSSLVVIDELARSMLYVSVLCCLFTHLEQVEANTENEFSENRFA
uniref:DNA_MISMATCH_REPAIR_2 domain-containing protein n=1 Tax=Toxocara canis TaxID=6265 RepID=A0A183U868_TOXCA